MLTPLLLCLSSVQGAQTPAAAPFTQADLQAIVAEIDKVAPHNDIYAYPIEAKLVARPEVNAQSGPVVDAEQHAVLRGQKWIPSLEMFQGLVDLARGDKRILRAVVAHELAHLSLGHTLENMNVPALNDLMVVHTRQQEFEADDAGCGFLVAAGHARRDLVDAMLLLDQHVHDETRPFPSNWLLQVMGDHASPVTRAARLTNDQDLLAAASRFEIGLAYMGCRRYSEALAYFDDAAARSPKIHEAVLNAASAALQDYYDRLPGAVQDEWLRPEFGPHLTDVVRLRGRAIEISDADRQRYATALDRIQRTRQDFQPPMKLFLLATAQVLEPTGNEETIRAGIKGLEYLKGLSGPGGWDWQLMRQRTTNNIAVGLQRLGEGKQAAQALLTDVRRGDRVLYATIENLARLPLEPLEAKDATTVASLLFSYLTWAPAGSAGSRAAERAADALKRKHGLSFTQAPLHPPVALCSAAMIAIDGHEVGLFDHFGKVSEILGSIPEAGPVNSKYPELQFLLWNGGDVLALMEGEQLVKITSYRKDTALELRPLPESGLRQNYRVRVGMSEAEFESVLNPAGGSKLLNVQELRLLGRRSFTTQEAAQGAASAPPKDEVWRYYPGLEFGVLIENGIVTGITVAPVTVPAPKEAK